MLQVCDGRSEGECEDVKNSAEKDWVIKMLPHLKKFFTDLIKKRVYKILPNLLTSHMYIG